MKRALVTGGAGFVGSCVVRALVERGVNVSVIDDLSVGKRERLDVVMSKISFYHNSLFDADALQKAIAGADAVFHLAAQVSVPESIKDPAKAFHINVEGTKQVLGAARGAGVRRFVYSSSAAVYGDPTTLPVTEETPTHPLSPYGETKLKGEELCRTAQGIETVSLRYMNIVGVGQDVSSPYAAVVPLFLQKVKNGTPLTIQGDGTQTRDFVDLEDVVWANIRAAEAVGVAGTVFNIGSGIEVALNQLVTTLEEVLGKKLVVEYGPPREGDIYRSVADIRHARELLGWEPKVPFKESIKRILGA